MMQMKSNRGPAIRGLIAGCWLALAAAASAQPAGGMKGPRLAPEKQDAAWALEAKTVASDGAIGAEPAAKVAEAYKAARKSYDAAAQKLLEDSAGNRLAAMEGFIALRAQESSKLENSLRTIIKDEQVKPAMASLGAFNPYWDQMADTLAGMKLDDEKLLAAMKFTKEYVEKMNAAQEASLDTMDFQALRETGQALKTKLDGDLAPLLTAEQLAHWKDKTTLKRVRRESGAPAAPGQPAPAAPTAPAVPGAAK